MMSNEHGLTKWSARTLLKHARTLAVLRAVLVLLYQPSQVLQGKLAGLGRTNYCQSTTKEDFQKTGAIEPKRREGEHRRAKLRPATPPGMRPGSLRGISTRETSSVLMVRCIDDR